MALKDTVKKLEEETHEFPDVEDSFMEMTSKRIISIYGDKGTGKSTLAYSLMAPKDSCYVLSFDKKSMSPLDINVIKNMGLDVKVVNPTRYYTKRTDPIWLSSALESVDYINHLLDYAEKHEFDWIIIDCTEILDEIAQFAMRARYKCGCFGGVQIPFWKERRRILDNVHDRAITLAKKGVIYTFYPTTEDILVRNGQVIDSKTAPKWIGKILNETDITIHTKSMFNNQNWQFMANIESSKDLFYKGGEYNVTDAPLYNILSMIDK